MGRVSKNNLIVKCQQKFIDHFESDSFYTAAAPGRINIIGEHTDYNLGLAMPIAIDRWICSVVSRRKDSKVNIYSSNFNEKVCLNMDDFNMPKQSWVKYSAGCVKVFMNEFGIDTGFDILIGGNVPIGFGVSSSAALEVSLLGALFYSSELEIDNYKILELSSKVENNFLGIKSGLLDQYASIFSKPNKPLLIDFSSMSHSYVKSSVSQASWVLINSMVDRALVGSEYNSRVDECQEALEKINYSKKIKIKMNDISDADLQIIKDSKILFKRLSHVLSENKRVYLMKNALESGDLGLVGKILNDSHFSLSRDYEVSCEEIDKIIDISSKIEGFYGGRIMGGGFGGCCLCLVDNYRKESFANQVVQNFQNQFKYELKVEFVDFSEGLSLFRKV